MNVLLLMACAAASATLPARHMNTWYPSGDVLSEMIEEAMSIQGSLADPSGLVRAVIVPHAGYSYCLDTSIRAYQAIDATAYDRVFVIGPSHRVPIWEIGRAHV